MPAAARVGRPTEVEIGLGFRVITPLPVVRSRRTNHRRDRLDALYTLVRVLEPKNSLSEFRLFRNRDKKVDPMSKTQGRPFYLDFVTKTKKKMEEHRGRRLPTPQRRQRLAPAVPSMSPIVDPAENAARPRPRSRPAESSIPRRQRLARPAGGIPGARPKQSTDSVVFTEAAPSSAGGRTIRGPACRLGRSERRHGRPGRSARGRQLRGPARRLGRSASRRRPGVGALRAPHETAGVPSPARRPGRRRGTDSVVFPRPRHGPRHSTAGGFEVGALSFFVRVPGG